MVVKINTKSKILLLLGESKEKVGLFLKPRNIFQSASQFVSGTESVPLFSLLNNILVELFEAYLFLQCDSW